MNKRILELVKQAGFENSFVNDKDGIELVFVDKEHTTKCVEQFAKLLIQECIDICKDVKYVGFVPPESAEVARYYDDGAEDCADIIKARLGGI